MVWLKTHERLIIIFLVIIVITFLGNKYLDINVVKKDAKLDAITTQAASDKQTLLQIAAQAKDDTIKYQNMVDTLQRQNSSLISTIQSDTIALQSRQEKDQNLAPTELVTRWGSLINSPGVTVNTTGVNVTLEAAHSTVNQLEEVPVLKDQLSKGTEVLQNTQKLLNQAQVINEDLTSELKSDTLVIADDKKQLNAAVADVKAKDAKSKRNWALRGLIAGATITTYIFLHI